MKEVNGVVVGIGEILWDILPEGKKIGGAPANFAYHVSQSGLESLVVSAVGKDRLGSGIVKELEEKHVDMLIEEVEYPTGTVQVELDGKGIPQYEIKENVAWDNIPLTDRLRSIAEHTAAVCFGSLAQRNTVSRNTINEFLDLIPDRNGVYKVFDINLRQNFYTRDILSSSMERCNILKINDEELEEVVRLYGLAETDLQERCRRLISEYGLEILILTCGVHGSYVFTRDDISFIETPKVDVVDTVGAGDSFTASFVSALIKGKSVREAHQLAVDVSAFVCTQSGAMPVMPNH